ncbi:MAG: SdrD B-like domain-containing protein, partial [Romboutsia sp.]|uniref:SdrD B-like domain-containing protein n=1 Tax=Romboutsia sp. TaxID=1965302 RepID=UPI003F373E23
PGGRVIYTIVLENHLKSKGGNGDLGALISNVVISDLLPEGITIDPSFEVIGNDISGNIYTDTSSDNRVGVVDGNQITFTLNSYYGSKYRIIFVCNVNENVAIGTSITNTASLQIDGNDRGSASDTLLVSNSNYQGSISEYGPNYANVGSYISFEISASNSGNQDLINFTIEDDIPDEVSIYRINTGSFKIDVIDIVVPESYTIEYEVNHSGVYNLLGSYNTQSSSYVTLPTLSSNEKITKIIWYIPNFPVGIVPSKNIILDGVVTSNNTSNLITNTGLITWKVDNVEQFSQTIKSVNISDTSELNIRKSISNNAVNVIPGQIITYSISFDGYYSQINNPVITDLLSNKVEYVGNEVYSFYDYFNNKTITSASSNFLNVVSINKEVINNFNNTNQVLVRYNMNGFLVRQRGKFTIKFDVRVKIGMVGSISNNAMLGTFRTHSVIASGQLQYLDVDDRDNDDNDSEYLALSYNVNSNILYYAGLTSKKKIKGALDTSFLENPSIGSTYEGGSVDYKILITNSGNLNFNYIELIDILPHINDTGVILTDVLRNSQYNIYNINKIVANIMENNIVIDDVSLTIEYSQSYNPLRFSLNNFGNNTIGVTNDWSTTLPNPITSTYAVKIILSNKHLLPNQSLVINMNCVAPVGITTNYIAYNSVAIKATYINENNVVKSLIPVEPQKVGLKIIKVDKASIGGITWLDKNENGDIDNSEVGVNGIIARLFSSNNTLVSQTITTNNNTNSPGHYVFNNLDKGQYYIQFVRPQSLYFTKYNEATQNKASTNTGFTELINIISQNENILNIDAGFIDHIDLILMLLELLHQEIYTSNCDSLQDIISSINNSNMILIGILNTIQNVWSQELDSGKIEDLGYKSQLQRLLYTVNFTISKLMNIILYPNLCDIQLLSNILYTLTEYILNMVCLISDKEGLYSYYNKCTYFGSDVFELIMGRFINNITALESINIRLNSLLGVLYSTSSNKNYIPIYVPKK